MTTTSNFRGVYAIPVTPFNEDLTIDWHSLRKCIDFSVDNGAHGIVLPVNASEGPFLTDAERKEVLKTGIEVVAGAVPVIGGVSGASTVISIELTKNAASLGADAVMAMPPNGAGGSTVRANYAAISEARQHPVRIQNNTLVMRRKFFTFKPFIDVLFCCLLMLVAILFLLKTEEDAGLGNL